MSKQRPAHGYVVGVFETQVVVAKVHERNLQRAEDLMLRRPGPDREELEEYATGTAEEILAAMPKHITEDVLKEADRVYALNPQHQIQFTRTDLND